MKKKQTYLERLIREEMRRAISEKRLNESWAQSEHPRGPDADQDWSDEPGMKKKTDQERMDQSYRDTGVSSGGGQRQQDGSIYHKPKTRDWTSRDPDAHKGRVSIAIELRDRGANVKLQGNQQREWFDLLKALEVGDVKTAIENAQALGADVGPEMKTDWRDQPTDEEEPNSTLADKFKNFFTP